MAPLPLRPTTIRAAGKLAKPTRKSLLHGDDQYLLALGCIGLRHASTTTSITPSNRKERVVILGSGWAGYSFARSLDPKKYERILISPRSYFVFTPLVAGTAVGTLEFRAAMEPVRRLNLDNFHQGWADDVDFAAKTIRVEANTSDDLVSMTQLVLQKGETGTIQGKKGPMFDVPYDKLVIAVGAYSQTFGIEGVKEHANFLRDVGDARKIRMKVLQSFEKAALPITTDEERKKLLHFAIVGGGPTGIEYAAELHDLIQEDLKKTYPELMKFVNITVYDVAPKVLPMFDQKLAQYAMDRFKREGIHVKTEHHLTRIRPDEDCEGCLKLKIKEYGDEEVGAGIVVWSTGLMQNPLVQKLESKTFQAPGGAKSNASSSSSEVHIQKDAKSGGITTDPYLRVNVNVTNSKNNTETANPLPDVFAIGDCAVISSQPDPNSPPLPATAQVASQKALYLAKQFNQNPSFPPSSCTSRSRSRKKATPQPQPQPQPFRFRNLGTMTYLGGWTAILQSGADVSGYAAWLLWRTAYLTRTVSVRNKIMVPVYWFVSWVFGRDISRF